MYQRGIELGALHNPLSIDMDAEMMGEKEHPLGNQVVQRVQLYAQF